MTSSQPTNATPPHLVAYAERYAVDPRSGARAWFADAGLGLFLHYGISALHGKGDWGMYTQTMPIVAYEGLAEQFTAASFDADFITDLACEAEARYLTITTKHHDGFLLWDSANCAYNAANSAAGRDLVGELAASCQAKGLGLFVYYSYALDWHHPWFFDNRYFDRARPAYAYREPRYRFREPADFRRYIDDVHAQLRELLTGYGDLAGVWFDPELAYHAQAGLFPIDETYALIRKLQPHALIAFKHGATGDEDFAAPEGRGAPLLDKIRARVGEAAAHHAEQVWAGLADRRGEICDTLSWSWGYHENNPANHIDADAATAKLAEAWRRNCNLLLNTGPEPSGAIPAPDIATLRELGRRIRAGEIPDHGGDAFATALPASAPIT